MSDTLSVRAIAKADWPAIVSQFADLGFEQTVAYAEPAAARIGAETVYLAFEDATGVQAAASLRLKRVPGLGRGIAWAHAAPMTVKRDGTRTPLAACLTALRQHVVEEQGHVLRLRLPVLAGYTPQEVAEVAKAAGFVPTQRAPDYHSITVDLTRDEDVLMAGLHGKWRSPLRATLKTGMQIDQGLYNDFYDRFRVLYDEVQDAKGFAPTITPEFYRDVAGSDFEHRVLIATHEGQDLGAITVGLAGQAAVYLFGATAEAGRKLNAGYFLTWQGYLMAKAWGAHVYDLGGIDPEDNPTVTRFKRRAGGTEVSALPWQAHPTGLAGQAVLKLEALRARLKGQG